MFKVMNLDNGSPNLLKKSERDFVISSPDRKTYNYPSYK